MTTRRESEIEHICSLGGSRYKRRSDIREGDIVEVRMYNICASFIEIKKGSR